MLVYILFIYFKYVETTLEYGFIYVWKVVVVKTNFWMQIDYVEICFRKKNFLWYLKQNVLKKRKCRKAIR